jgi:NAD/NADP transhydrogenase beta subunit
MHTLKRAGERFEVVGEIFAFLWQRKLWWMIPMVFVILVVGVLLVLAQGSAIAPFIYTLF